MKRAVLLAVLACVLLIGRYEYINGRLSFNTKDAVVSYSPAFKGLPAGVVETPQDWENYITKAIENLEEGVEVTIINYNETDYDLENIGISEVGIHGEYISQGKRTEMTCKFDYQDNYALLRACEDSSLRAKLTNEQKQVLAEVERIVASIITDSMSDYTKEIVLHDYLVKNFKYDYQNYTNSTVPDEAYQITGFIKNKMGVCNAYAYTFQLMAKLAGLDTEVIKGELDGEKHAWNLIKLDNEYYHLDVTSDDPIPDSGDNVRYDYFNMSDEQADNDYTWVVEEYPAANGTKYNYFTYNSIVVTDYESFSDVIRNALSLGSQSVSFWSKGYVIENIDMFYEFAREFGYQYVELSGQLGKDGAFTVNFR